MGEQHFAKSGYISDAEGLTLKANYQLSSYLRYLDPLLG